MYTVELTFDIGHVTTTKIHFDERKEAEICARKFFLNCFECILSEIYFQNEKIFSLDFSEIEV